MRENSLMRHIKKLNIKSEVLQNRKKSNFQSMVGSLHRRMKKIVIVFVGHIQLG